MIHPCFFFPSQSQASRIKTDTPRRPLKRKAAEYTSSSEDDTPLASSPVKPKIRSAAIPMPGASAATTVPASAVRSAAHATNGFGNSNSTVDVSMGESDNEVDASPKKPATNGKAKGKKGPVTKRAKKDISDGESDFAADSEDEKPKKKARATKAKARTKVTKDEDASDEDDKPLVKKATKRSKKVQDATTASSATQSKRATKPKKEKVEPSSPKKKKAKEGDGEEGGEEEEDVYKWWEDNPNGDGSVKWSTLEHNGVFFPPPYESLPSAVKMKYNGALVDTRCCDIISSAL